MSNTTFIDGTTTIVSSWLNDVNDVVYDVLGDGTNVPTTPAEIRTNIQAAPETTGTSILKGNGSGGFSAATAGTDYLTPPSGSAILKANSGSAVANAVDGTDYLSPTTGTAKTAATGSIVVAKGTQAQRDGTPQSGYFRFNTDTNQFEGYNGTTWGAVGAGASGGSNNPFVYENDITVTADYTLTTNKNGMSAGPVTVASGVTVTVPSGSVWTVV